TVLKTQYRCRISVGSRSFWAGPAGYFAFRCQSGWSGRVTSGEKSRGNGGRTGPVLGREQDDASGRDGFVSAGLPVIRWPDQPGDQFLGRWLIFFINTFIKLLD